MRAAQAEVAPSVINDCFKYLTVSLEKIPVQNIYNYDEPNVTDNPESKTI